MSNPPQEQPLDVGVLDPATATAPKKEQDKDDEDVKKDRDGFQQQQNVINVIFGGDPSFSKRAQKLCLHLAN